MRRLWLEQATLVDFVAKKRRGGYLSNPIEDIRESASVPKVRNKIGGRIGQAGRDQRRVDLWTKPFASCRADHFVMDPLDFMAHAELSIAKRNIGRQFDPLKAKKIAPVFDEDKAISERRCMIGFDRDDRRDEGKTALDAEQVDEIHLMLSGDDRTAFQRGQAIARIANRASEGARLATDASSISGNVSPLAGSESLPG